MASGDWHAGHEWQPLQPNRRARSLARALSSAALIHEHSTHASHPPFRPQKPPTLLQNTAFICLELLFAGLSIAALALDGIPLPQLALRHPTETKGVATLIFIIWHSIAIYTISAIISSVFSTEWSFMLKHTGHIIYGETDRVSTLQAGLWDRIVHFSRQKTSTAFKLAFLASIACMGLAALGPASIMVQVGETTRKVDLRVRNMTITSGVADPNDVTTKAAIAVEAAWMINRLERVENGTFGYTSPVGLLAPWPARVGNLTYPTDVIQYQHVCHWEAPMFVGIGSLTAGGAAWLLWGDQLEVVDYEAAILPLLPVEPSGLSAFLFLGSNTTINQLGYGLFLDNLPSLFNVSGFSSFFPPSNQTLGSSPPLDPEGDPTAAQLASVIVCDPQVSIVSAEVTVLKNDRLEVTPTPNKPKIGNILESAANIVFSQGLFQVVAKVEPYGDTVSFVQPTPARIFTSSSEVKGDIVFRPFTDGEIGTNMDNVFPSISKAFMDTSLRRPMNEDTESLVAVSALEREERLLLSTNIAAFACAEVLVLIILITIFALGKTSLNEPLTSSSAIIALETRPRVTTSTLDIEQVPLSATPYDLSTENSRSGFLSIIDPPTSLDKGVFPTGDIIRILAFLAIEALYLTLGFISLSNQGILLSPSFDTIHLKSIVTILAIIWQGCAFVCVQALVTLAISSEWFVHHQTPSSASTKEENNISTLSSSHLDRTIYFWSGHASNHFRLAYFTLLVLAVLQTLGPSTFQLGAKAVTGNVVVQVANLTMDTNPTFDYEETQSFARVRANLIARTEQIEGWRYGYEMEPGGMFAAWPTLGSISAGDVYFYPTDLVKFGHSCEWKTPIIQLNSTRFSVQIDGEQWRAGLTVGNFQPKGKAPPALVPLEVVCSQLRCRKKAYLFLGDNDPNTGNSRTEVFDLTGLPTASFPSLGTDPELTASFAVAPFASTLVCDLHYSLATSMVMVTPDKILRPTSGNVNTVGNIPEDMVAFIFDYALLEILGEMTATSISDAVEAVFLGASDTKRPQDLAKISANMDVYAASAAKAFLDGYESIGGIDANFTTIPVNGALQKQRLALKASKALLITTTVLVSIATICLATLTAIVWINGVAVPLTLENVMKATRM